MSKLSPLSSATSQRVVSQVKLHFSSWLIYSIAILAWLTFTWALQFVAFRPQGSTQQYLANQSAQYARTISAAQPNYQPLDQVTVDIWFLSAPRTFYPQEIFAEKLDRGQTADGQPTYSIEFTEPSLNRYLDHWFGGWAKRVLNLRNTHMALHTGGLIISAEVHIGTGWQTVGAAFTLDASGRQFTFAGVDINGQLFSAPPRGPIADTIDLLMANGNRALRELKFIDPAGELYIRQIVLAEGRAQVVVLK